MPKYVIKRSFSIREDQMPEIGRPARQIIEQQLPEITWLHNHIAVDEVYEVAGDVTPEDFPLTEEESALEWWGLRVSGGAA